MISDSLRAWMDEIEEAAADRGYEAGKRDAEFEHCSDYQDGMRSGIDIGRRAGSREGRQDGRRQGAWRALWACLGLLVVAVVLGRRV
jgi:flagellar biosynthesis/type III secretory pathway protein FliH